MIVSGLADAAGNSGSLTALPREKGRGGHWVCGGEGDEATLIDIPRDGLMQYYRKTPSAFDLIEGGRGGGVGADVALHGSPSPECLRP